MEYLTTPNLDMEYLDPFIVCRTLDMVYLNLFIQYLWQAMEYLNLYIIQHLQQGMEYLNLSTLYQQLDMEYLSLFIMSVHCIQLLIILPLIQNQDMEYLNQSSMIQPIHSTLNSVDCPTTPLITNLLSILLPQWCLWYLLLLPGQAYFPHLHQFML